VDDVEEQVASFYASQSLAAADSQKLRLAFRTQLKDDQKLLTAEAVRQGRRLEELMTERRKLLELHYKDRIAPDLFEEEQTRINLEIKVARRAIEDAEQQWDDIEATSDAIFDLIDDLEGLYRSLSPTMKRRLNRLLYSKILIDKHDDTKAELAEPPSAEWMARYMKVVRKTAPTMGALALKILETHEPGTVFSVPGSNIVTLVALIGRLSNRALLDRLGPVIR